jgi:hypothetical protein
MFGALQYMPWSAVGFILGSIVLIVYRINHKEITFLWLFGAEAVLFFICMVIGRIQSRR